MDDVFKIGLGAVVTGIGGVVSWLVKGNLSNRETAIVTEQRLKALEDAMQEAKKSQITREEVREEIDDALLRRDKVNVERRSEWEKRLNLEIRESVRQEVKKGVDQLVTETRKLGGKRRPSGEGSDG